MTERPDEGPNHPTLKKKEGPPPLGEIRVITEGLASGGESVLAWKVHVRKSKHVKGKSIYMIGRPKK